MSNASEIKDFLTTRRARLTPERAGLPRYGRHRRVSGLRREEVALLAGISVEYYTRLERGNARGVSDDVLESVSRALQLDEAEHSHLLDLVRTANLEQVPRRMRVTPRVRPSIARVVDAFGELPAMVQNGRLDIVYANRLGEALYMDLFLDPVKPPNPARYLFLDPRARAFYADWDQTAHDIAAALHQEAGRNPYDRSLSDLIGLLSTRSEQFRQEWARHDVRRHLSGTKRVRHSLVGELSLDYEVLELPADPGLTLVTYSAVPGSESAQRLSELAGWASERHRLRSSPQMTQSHVGR
jgi:transcriptional regulator with XRE-family HTH domain